MKTVKSFRVNDDFGADDNRRGTKLPPMKKSGKERHGLYSSIDDDYEEEYSTAKRESVFDYFDDEEEER